MLIIMKLNYLERGNTCASNLDIVKIN